MPDDVQIIESLSATLAFEYGVRITPEMVTQVPLDTPIYNRVRGLTPVPVVRPDAAAIYGKLTAVDFTGNHNDGAFRKGGDPPGIDLARDSKSLVKRSYGASAGIADVDVIASTTPGAPNTYMARRFRDDAAFLLELLFVKTLTAIDFSTVKGNNTSNPFQFNGIETMVTAANGSKVHDHTGTAFSKDKLDFLIIEMMSYGIQPSAIYCHPIAHKHIVDAYTGTNTNVSLNVELGRQDAVLGLWGNRVVTPAGVLPIVTSRKFTMSGSGTSMTGDVFVMAERHEGIPILYYDWQVEPVALPLAKILGRDLATSSTFAVWSHLVLVERTDWWAQGRLKDVVFDSSAALNLAAVVA